MAIYHIRTAADGTAAELEVSADRIRCVGAGRTRFEIDMKDLRWVEQTAHDVIRLNFLDGRGLMVQVAVRSAHCQGIVADIIGCKRRRRGVQARRKVGQAAGDNSEASKTVPQIE